MVNQQIVKEEDNLKFIKEEEYLEGDIYSNGTFLGYKNEGYEMFKAKKNPRAGGAVDLILTGSFLDSFYLLKPKKNEYLFGATDKKRNLLVNKYGKGIMGLNQETFNKFQKEIIAPRFIREIKRQLGQ